MSWIAIHLTFQEDTRSKHILIGGCDELRKIYFLFIGLLLD